MAANKRLAQVWPKVERAKKHVKDLDVEIDRFHLTNPYRVSVERDQDTQKPVYYVSSAEAIPNIIALIAGDAIQNLMSALDHLAYQLVCAATSDNPPSPKRIYFPIDDDAAKYEDKKIKKLQGARQTTIDAIDAIKPYKGGNDLLWVLHQLNNVEKHRLLLTVGSKFGSVNIAPMIMRDIVTMMTRHLPEGQAVPTFDLFLNPADVLFPLKVGDQLFVDLPDAEINEKMQFRFDVALSESRIVEARSLMELLIQLTKLVENIISNLAPELA